MPQENDSTDTSTSSVPASFEGALALQQQQRWNDSLAEYQKLLDQGLKQNNQLSPVQASVIYHNMATIAYEQNDPLKAYVWSKKAISLNPSNLLAQKSFEHYSTQFQSPHVAQNTSGFENLKQTAGMVPLDIWFIISTLLILLSFWLLLKKVFHDRKSAADGFYIKAIKWPIAVAFLSAILLSTLTAVVYLDQQIPRALVVTESASVQTAPGENKPVIFAAPAGFEVEVLQSQEGYYQIRRAGVVSGWMKQSDLELLRLRL